MSESFLLCSNYDMENSMDRSHYPVSIQQQIYDDGLSVTSTNRMHSSVHHHDRYAGVNIYDSQELDLNATFTTEYNVPDNALAYIDDILNVDSITFDISDSEYHINDSSAFKKFPHSASFAPLPSFRLDNLNGLVDERDTVGTLEDYRTTQKQEEINRKNSVASVFIDGELEWHGSHPVLPQQKCHRCDECEVLHQMVHMNGNQGTKLEIHGCVGEIYHAVIQTRFLRNEEFPASVQQQMVEFPVGNVEYVKQFLLQYSLLRKKEGFTLWQDSCLPDINRTCCKRSTNHFAAALGTRCISESIHGCDPADLAEEFPANEQAYSHNVGEVSEFPTRPIRNNTAAQREKTGRLKMSDLAKHFHLPINVAAKELGICPTVLKKICRRNGMRRWPHRKIKSIERIIATLEQTIADGSGQGDEDIRKEIALLRNERSQLCAGLLGQL